MITRITLFLVTFALVYGLLSFPNYMFWITQPVMAFLPASNTSNSLNQSIAITNGTPSFIKFIIKVDNTGGGAARAGDFSLSLAGPEITPNYISGFTNSTNGSAATISRALPGTYTIKANVNGPYTIHFSGDCMQTSSEQGKIVVKPGVKLTCTVTASYVNF